MSDKFSIIIPTLNVVEEVEAWLQSLYGVDVIDGQSDDGAAGAVRCSCKVDR